MPYLPWEQHQKCRTRKSPASDTDPGEAETETLSIYHPRNQFRYFTHRKQEVSTYHPQIKRLDVDLTFDGLHTLFRWFTHTFSIFHTHVNSDNNLKSDS